MQHIGPECIKSIPILPEPAEITYTDRFLKLQNSIGFEIMGLANCDRISFHIRENFAKKYVEITILNSDSLSDTITANIPAFSSDIEKTGECYQIKYSNGRYIILAPEEKGLFYGLVSLSQLIFRVEKGPDSYFAIQEVSILDYPAFEMRGASEQICHGQVPTVDSLKHWITYMARYKSNLLILNLEDIMGFDKYPEIGAHRGALTGPEISGLSDFAELYFCDLVPGFQCLGHLENFLYHPEFREYAEFPGGNSLNLSNPKTYELLEYFYREICSKFRSKYVHIEMDEAYDFGLFASKSLIKERGRDNVLLEHILKIHHLLSEELGKTILMYHDTLLTEKSIIDKLPKDIRIISWKYLNNAKKNDFTPFLSKDLFTIASPSIINWTRPFPYLSYAYENMEKMSTIGKLAGCKGFINSAWGDFSNENFIPLNIFPFAYGCYVAWNPTNEKSNKMKEIGFGSTRNRFKLAFSRDYFDIDYFNSVWDLLELIASFNRKHAWNTPFFLDLWDHPFNGHPRGDLKWAKVVASKMLLAREYFDLLEPKIDKNKQIFEYLDYAIEILTYQSKKVQYSASLHARWKKPDRFVGKQELPNLEKMISELQHLKNKYSSLWLQCAKPQGLERVLKNFENLESWFREMKTCIENKRIIKEPLIDAEWISHPTAQNLQQKFYFRKKFTLNEKRFSQLTKAYIQGIANTYMEIYVNGVRVGEVISRFYLSPVIYDNSVKIFDIMSNLTQGENCIEIVAREFTYSFVTVNTYCELFFDTIDAKLIYKTDKSWATSVENPNPDGERKWVAPKCLGKPPKLNGPIYRPDFLIGKPSIITRELGKLGYTHSMILNRTKSKTIANFAIKLLKK